MRAVLVIVTAALVFATIAAQRIGDAIEDAQAKRARVVVEIVG